MHYAFRHPGRSAQPRRFRLCPSDHLLRPVPALSFTGPLAALRDLLDHLERAARGDLEEALYLSPIPVGTGKTTALISFAETLMDSPEQEDVGMLITVNRIAEARDVAAKLSLHRSKLCVITSDAATNALGDHEAADKATRKRSVRLPAAARTSPMPSTNSVSWLLSSYRIRVA
jgi:uridylate kinase